MIFTPNGYHFDHHPVTFQELEKYWNRNAKTISKFIDRVSCRLKELSNLH